MTDTQEVMNRLIKMFLFLSVLLPTLLLSNFARADNGEFWDAAVASVISTKKMDKSYFQLKTGSRYVMAVDPMEVSPAAWNMLAEVSFYGFKVNRYSRLFSFYAQTGIGVHTEQSKWRLDAHRARISIYHYLNGGSISLGVIGSERQKAANEQFSVSFKSLEYTTGGAMKSFIFALTTSALGYEYRRYFTQTDYHGFYVFGLGLSTGFVLARKEPVSFEIKLKGDVAFSWPRQKDIETLLELGWHINGRKLPLDLSLNAGYDYYTEDSSNNNVSYDFFFATALLGARF